MKIVIHDYAGHPFQVQLSRCLATRGHQVTHLYAGGLLTPRGALQRTADDVASFDIRPVEMAAGYRENKYSLVKRRGYETGYGRSLVKELKVLAPDLVVSGNTPTEPQWYLVKEMSRLGVPVITWVQDFYSLAVTKLLSRKLPVAGAMIGWWYRRLDAKCFKRSQGVIGITDDFVPHLQTFGVPESRIATVPNWAPLEELPMRPRQNSWAAAQQLEGKFVFLYSGTLAMKHNPDMLVALATGLSGDPRMTLVVISEGPGADYLKEQQRRRGLGNLMLLPFQPFGEMPNVLASANVLVTLLEADAGVFSVPSKVLTYLCAGRPILGAMPAENLASKTLVEIGAGRVVGPDDEAAFVQAGTELLNSPERETRMGQRARAYAEERFDIESITNRFEEAFERFKQSA